MKRTVLSYVFTLVVILCCFSAVYSIQYDRLRQELIDREYSDRETGFGQNKTDEQETDDSVHDEEDTTEAGKKDQTAEAESNAEEVDLHDELRTNPSMLYVVGQYDWNSEKVTETVEKFPKELLGLTRQELLIFLSKHSEYGSLLSFSEHAVYMRKSDHPDWSEYSYFLRLDNGIVMVYYLKDGRLYLDTGIKEEELSEENGELLREGIYIRDNAALFDYLQTVTS